MSEDFDVDYEYIFGANGEGFAITDDLLTIYNDEGEAVEDMTLRRAFFILKNYKDQYSTPR